MFDGDWICAEYEMSDVQKNHDALETLITFDALMKNVDYVLGAKFRFLQSL